MIMPFLVESALMTHGLASMADAELLERWPFRKPCIAWLERGRLKIGTIADYLPLRRRADAVARVSAERFAAAVREKRDAALTASGTMLAADLLGIPFVVTSGMGGVCRGEDDLPCSDLAALLDFAVILIAASPKDVLDIDATLARCRETGVPVFGLKDASLGGFLLRGPERKLDILSSDRRLKPPLLLLNPIAAAKRLDDDGLLAAALAAGRSARKRGRPFHPAANACFDEQTNGYTSVIQFEQLIENARQAERLAGRLTRTGPPPRSSAFPLGRRTLRGRRRYRPDAQQRR